MPDFWRASCFLILLSFFNSGQALDPTPLALTNSPDNTTTADQLTRVGGLVVFLKRLPGRSGYVKSQVWRTDGTPSGTFMLIDPEERVSLIWDFNGTILFVVESPGSNGGLYASDGTVAGTILLKRGVEPYRENVVTVGSWAFFALDSAIGSELWKTDGSVAGTQRVKDFMGSPGSGGPSQLTAVGSSLYFLVREDLWRTDGTESGTILLRERSAVGLGVGELAAFGNRLLFSAIDAMGKEPWISDGTPAGTVRLVDLCPGESGSEPRRFTTIGEFSYFWARGNDPDGNYNVWRTDGSPSGTEKLNSFAGHSCPDEHDVAVIGSTLYFSLAQGTQPDLWLYKVEGTTVTHISPTFPPSPHYTAAHDLAVAGGKLYFSSYSYATGDAVWRSDGTPDGTLLYVKMGAGSVGALWRGGTEACIVPLGSVLVVSGTDWAPHGYEAWRIPIQTTPSVVISAPTTAPALTTRSATLSIGGNASDDLLDGLLVTYQLSGATSGGGTATGTSSWKTTVALNIGATTITVQAKDANGATASDVLLVTRLSANSPPLITTVEPARMAVDEDGAASIQVAASDPDGDPLTWSIVTQGGKGAASVSATGMVDYIPNANATGIDAVTLSVSDGRGGSDTISLEVAISAINDAPSFVKGPDLSILEDQGAQTIAGWATGISRGPADESPQTVSFAVTANTKPALFRAGPAIAADGTLNFTPAANANGSATITLELRDNGGVARGGRDTSTAQTFKITVTAVNDPPEVVSPIPDQVAPIGSLYTYTFSNSTFVDVDGDTLIYSASGMPGWLAFNPSTRTFSGTASGTASSTVTVTARDSAGAAVADAFTVTPSGNLLPSGWATADIGAVGASGAATSAGGTWTILGSGADIWGRSDEFRFASLRTRGDVVITARVSGLTSNHSWAKAGVMIRETLQSASAHAFSCLSSGHGSALQRRLVTGGTSVHTGGPGLHAPGWIRLERTGNLFIGSVSTNGTTWIEIRRETVAMAAEVFVGLAVTSHSDGTLATATFSDVSVIAATSSAN